MNSFFKGNPEGSRETYENQFFMTKTNKLKDIKIPKEVRDILHGYIMSDGYIRDGVLTVDQSKKQKLFVMWLYTKFQSIRTVSPIKKVVRTQPDNQTKTYSLRFFTRAILKGFHHMWYEPVIHDNKSLKYRKKLPKSIDCFFNENFISVWYAGDGTKILGSIGAKFEVTSFTIEERLRLKNLFLTKFGIKTQIISSGISKKGNRQWALKIGATEYPKFRALITKIDLIPTIFPYKLHKKT